MNAVEISRALRSLHLGGMAENIEMRALQAQSETLSPLDFLSLLVSDELSRRGDSLLKRRIHQARFRDTNRKIDSFDFEFNQLDKRQIFELATCKFISRQEDILFLGPPGTGKSHLAQALGHAAIIQGYRVMYREAHALLEEIAEASLTGDRKLRIQKLASVELLIIDDLGMKKLPSNAAEELLEIIMRRYEKASTIITSNRPVDDWGKLLGDTACVTALLDRILHHGHVIKCGNRSYRIRKPQGLWKEEQVG